MKTRILLLIIVVSLSPLTSVASGGMISEGYCLAMAGEASGSAGDIRLCGRYWKNDSAEYHVDSFKRAMTAMNILTKAGYRPSAKEPPGKEFKLLVSLETLDYTGEVNLFAPEVLVTTLWCPAKGEEGSKASQAIKNSESLSNFTEKFNAFVKDCLK